MEHRLFYCDQYAIPLPDGHKFPMAKYRMLRDLLVSDSCFRFEAAPFASERYASYAIGVWSALERAGDVENADRMSIVLAKRLARDLHQSHTIEETTLRSGRRLRP